MMMMMTIAIKSGLTLKQNCPLRVFRSENSFVLCPFVRSGGFEIAYLIVEYDFYSPPFNQFVPLNKLIG